MNMKAKRFIDAERGFGVALKQQPGNDAIARQLGAAMLEQQRPDGKGARVAAKIERLCGQFPDDGMLQSLLAVALARENRIGDAVVALDRAVELAWMRSDGQGRKKFLHRRAELSVSSICRRAFDNAPPLPMSTKQLT